MYLWEIHAFSFLSADSETSADLTQPRCTEAVFAVARPALEEHGLGPWLYLKTFRFFFFFLVAIQTNTKEEKWLGRENHTYWLTEEEG